MFFKPNSLKYFFLSGIILFSLSTPLWLFAQYSVVFSETFESCAPGNLPNCGWTQAGTGSPWRITSSSCTITGIYSLAIGSSGIDCQYNISSDITSVTAYKALSSSGYQLLDISFNWHSGGETGVDYGELYYSTDLISWFPVSGTKYQNTFSIQAASNLSLPASTWNQASFYIGFRWYDDDNGLGAFPGFTVDNIIVRGEQIVPDSPPNPAASASGCDSVIITRTGSPPLSSNVVWYWQGASCGTDSGLGSGITYTAFTSDTYYIRAFNTVSGLWSQGCGSVAVNIMASPTGNAGYDGTACDLDYTLNAAPSAFSGTWTHVAGPGSSIFSNINDPDATVSVSGYGVYIYSWAENNGGCISSDQVTISFFQQPFVNFYQNTDTADLSVSGEVSFVNLTSGVDSLLWDFGDGTTSAEQNPTHVYDSQGTYTVTLTCFINPCSNSATSTVTVINTSGIYNNHVQNEIKIYPNPFNMTLEMEFVNPSTRLPFSLVLFNPSGSVVKEIKGIRELRFKISREGLQEGVYFYRIYNDSGDLIFGKMVIE